MHKLAIRRIALLCFFTILAVCCLAGCTSKPDQYSEAMELYDAGNFADAETIFEELGNYEESEAMLLQCKYSFACELMNAESYDAAAEAFAELGSYEDSKQKIDACYAQKDPFGTIYDYYCENGLDTGNGLFLCGITSFSHDTSCLLGVNKETEELLFGLQLKDNSAIVSIALNKTGEVNITVNTSSNNESVTGTIQINASEYKYGDTLSDFSYASAERDWGYDNFLIRANDYIRNTLLYADLQIDMLDLDLSLEKLGFSSYKTPNIFTETIGADDVAGMWECRNDDERSDSVTSWPNRIFMIDDSIYWQSWDPNDSAPSADQMMSNDYLLSKDIEIAPFDALTGELIITDTNDNTSNTFKDYYRRYVYYDSSGTLKMRVESLYSGLSDFEDGKVYTKISDESPVHLSVSSDDTATKEVENATSGEKNALSRAKSYLDFAAFSYEGLVSQLEYEGFSNSEACFAAENCGADWKKQAVDKAKSYLSSSAFSYDGLISQLEYEKFTTEQATYAADFCGADWYEQAAKSAKNYLRIMSFSRDELIGQLEYEGFSSDEAEYGASQNGY